MKNPSRHSITSEMKKRVPMMIAIFAALAMLVLNMAIKEPAVRPDSVHPMANANVAWEQTFHAGSWGDGK